MKKIFCFIIILITILLIFHLNNDLNKNFIKDDTLFAVTLDNNLIDYIPSKPASSMAGYNISINCKNAVGTWDLKNWKLDLRNITGDIKCNLDFVTITTSNISSYTLNNIVKNDDEVINNNGYRYVGANPNNYVWYNNELWRIIGSIPTKKSNNVTADLVKIFRNDSLSVVNFDYRDWVSNLGDTGYHNNWGSNTLSKVLNNYYYGAKNATDKKEGDFFSSDLCRLYHSPDSTYGKCDYRYIGINTTSNAAKMIQEVYWNTGKITDSNLNNINFRCNGETSGTGVVKKIGLASCSDYNSIYNIKNTFNYVNWMSIKGVQYLISPRSDYNILYITPNGTFGETSVDNPMQVFPSLYLYENVYVVSGDGSINKPYIIAM